MMRTKAHLPTQPMSQRRHPTDTSSSMPTPAPPNSITPSSGQESIRNRGMRPTSKQLNRKSSGLTLIEVIASTIIVSMMAVAALNALAAATKSANSIGNRAIAAGLADELMSEILMQAYSDPDSSPVFGHESGESTTVRSAFDDVDDYNAWNASPPQYRDG